MVMTIKRRDSAIGNLQTSLRKVFECVPIQEDWSAAQITHELARKHQSIGSTSVVGSLNALKKSKLVVEPKSGYFKQIECRKMPAKKKIPATVTPETPLFTLRDILNKVDNLKMELEVAVLEVEEYIETSNKKVEKLDQLQSLLKSI